MRKSLKICLSAVIGSLLLVAVGCLPDDLSADAARRGQPTFDGNAWVTYWDFERGMREAVAVQSQLNSVSYFAAVLDGDGKVLIMGHPYKFTGQKFTRYRTPVKKYLTVVNDVYKDIHNPKGETVAKDTQILLKLFESPETINAHITDLFAIVKKHRFDGLEIDYENIWKDPEIARRYIRFLEILVPLAEKEEIPLRIILEPGFFEFGNPITTLATLMEDITGEQARIYKMDIVEMDYGSVIGKRVKGTIDRPLGSSHPDYPDMIYPINYGYVDGITGGDGEEQDVYVFGTEEATGAFEGEVIGVVHRLNDCEDKWIVSINGEIPAKEEILSKIAFQEQFYMSELYM